MAPVSPTCQPEMALITQHIVTTSACSDPSAAYKAKFILTVVTMEEKNSQLTKTAQFYILQDRMDRIP